MYMITKMLDGRWSGIYQTQNGTERFEANTRKGAVKNMIKYVKIMNHMDITEADMEFVEEEASTNVRCVSNEVFGNIANGVVKAIKFGSDDCDLHLNFFKDVVIDVCKFRKALEDIVKDGHAYDCPGVCDSIGCQCSVGIAKEALKGDE